VIAVALFVTVVSLLDYSVAYWRSTRRLPAPTGDGPATGERAAAAGSIRSVDDQLVELRGGRGKH
jgi:hypothetical protein